MAGGFILMAGAMLLASILALCSENKQGANYKRRKGIR